MAELFVVCAMLWGCVYPAGELTRDDLTVEKGEGDGGFTVRFSLLVEGMPDAAAGAHAAFAGLPSLSVLPGSFTPAVYKVSAYTEEAGPETAQTVYITPASGAHVTGTVSLPAVTALIVDVEAYSMWDGTIGSLSSAALILKKIIPFSETQVASGTLQITLNPLTDGAPSVTGTISLNLAWLQTLDLDDDEDGNQGVTKVQAVLYNFPANTAIADSTQNITGFSDETVEGVLCTTATIGYAGLQPQSYKLRLAFYRGTGCNIAIGYFTEIITVWPGSAANNWIDAEGVAHTTRFFSREEFYSAAASVAEITVKKGTVVLPVDDSDDPEIVVKASANAGNQITFKIKYDEGGNPSGKSLKSVKDFVNGTQGSVNLSSGFSYTYEDTRYFSTVSITIPSGLSTSYHIEIVIQAPDRVTTKTYTLRFAAAMLTGPSPAYYLTLANAINASTSVSAGSPDIITVFDNVSMTTVHSIIGKHISITVPDGDTITLSRASSNTTNAFFNIIDAGSLTLSTLAASSLILDGNSTLTPSAPLVNVDSGTFTLSSGVTLQNNRRSTTEDTQFGGGVCINSGGTFIMNGGTISGNTAAFGGGVFFEGSVFTMSGAARVSADNDVYLADNKRITIDSALTGDESVAKITPNVYSHDTRFVLDGIELLTNYEKFDVTPNGAVRYMVNNNGKLVLKPFAMGGSCVFEPAANPLYEIHTFNSSDTLTIITYSPAMDYLIVAGGGGGGFSGYESNNRAGGGGAGGLIYHTNRALTTGTYEITVGTGGAGGAGDYQKGSNGGNSFFNGNKAIGGGGGGYHQAGSASNGNYGGSGGGNAHNYPGFGVLAAAEPGQGHQGSYGQQDGEFMTGGGGGGAGAAAIGATGGAGRQIDITGSDVYYAGGGSGGWSGAQGGAGGGGSVGVSSGNGTNGTGGGGASGLNSAGGRGGNGIVIVRFHVQ